MQEPVIDDVLRCAGCGSTDTIVLHDYVPGMWGGGLAQCRTCGSRFRFTFTEEPEEQGQGGR